MAYLNRCNYYESCYSCKYANGNRIGDLTLGDSWGSNLTPLELKKGVSLVIVNTEKGKELLKYSPNLELVSVDPSAAMKNNGQLVSPSHKPEERERFIESIKSGKKVASTVFSIYKKQCLREEVIDVMKLKIKHIFKFH